MNRHQSFARQAVATRAAANSGVDPETGMAVQGVMPEPQPQTVATPNRAMEAELASLRAMFNADQEQRRRDAAAMEAELASLRAMLNAEQEQRRRDIVAREAELRELETLRSLHAQKEAEGAVDFSDVQLVQLDTDEAQRIADPIMRKVYEEQRRLKEEMDRKLAANERAVMQLTQSATEAQIKAKQRELDGEILKAHNDLYDILADPRFASFKSLPVTPSSSVKYGDLMSAAYFKDMNAKGFIEILDLYKAWLAPNDVNGMAQVDTAGGYGPVGLPVARPETLDTDTKVRLLHQRQAGKITRAQYRALLNPKTHEKAPN
jgi:hypothetical protein